MAQRLSSVLMGFGLFLAVGCDAPSEEEVRLEFDAYVARRNSCSVTDDCVLASASCPLGCYAAVNVAYRAEVERKAAELIEEYESNGRSCDYSCIVAVAECRAGRCEILSQ